jgi:hypothetical protein
MPSSFDKAPVSHGWHARSFNTADAMLLYRKTIIVLSSSCDFDRRILMLSKKLHKLGARVISKCLAEIRPSWTDFD